MKGVSVLLISITLFPLNALIVLFSYKGPANIDYCITLDLNKIEQKVNPL